MATDTAPRTDWGHLWRSGALPRFCFISLGIIFHAGGENMISTIMPAMVAEIGGVELNGWNFAIYEIGSIIAGAATGRLTTFWTVRTNMIAAALVYALGTVVVALAPDMAWALGGRLLSGFGGGALIALSFVAIQRYFNAAIWPQLIAIMSVVWGVAAFAGPLYGGIIGTIMSWRWAFGLLAIAGVVFAIACLFVLRHEPRPVSDPKSRHFPALALACLALGITAIAAAGVEARIPVAAGLVAAGLLGIVVFFVLDARNQVSRLFPSASFDPRTTVGAGFLMVAALSVSTCSFAFYGPLLLSAMHGFTPLTTGFIIASESVSWSLMSILIANAPRHREALIVRAGALMITAGVAGFAWAVPSGSIPGIVLFALLQGGGFGILWPFANRCVVEAAPEHEREVTASAFSTLQRMGYALGAAIAGIIANANGFSGGFTKAAAAGAALPLFLYFLPVAALGCWAAFRLARVMAAVPMRPRD